MEAHSFEILFESLVTEMVANPFRLLAKSKVGCFLEMLAASHTDLARVACALRREAQLA